MRNLFMRTEELLRKIHSEGNKILGKSLELLKKKLERTYLWTVVVI